LVVFAVPLAPAAAPKPTPPGAASRATAKDAPPALAMKPVQLIETRAIETTIGNPSLPAAADAWVAVIRGAKKKIDVEEFYLSTGPGEPMEPVMAALGDAVKRGVQIRFILDARMSRTYPRGADSLSHVAGWQVRLVDYGRIAGGVQHAKFFLVDGRIS